MNKILTLAFATILLASCNSNKTASNDRKIEKRRSYERFLRSSHSRKINVFLIVLPVFYKGVGENRRLKRKAGVRACIKRTV